MAKRKQAKRKRPGAYVGFRASEGLKAQLEAAAGDASRSLSSEVQFRIERSFQTAELLESILELTFDRRTAGLILLLGYCFNSVGRTGAGIKAAPMLMSNPMEWVQRMNDWTDDPWAFSQVRAAIEVILNAAQPSGPIEPPNDNAFTPSDFEVWGKTLAESFLKELGQGASSVRWEKRMAAVRQLLGPLADQMAEHVGDGPRP